MSGKKQHSIPQSVLRGFAVPGSGDVGQLHVFHKDRGHKINSIADTAAQKFFYSELPTSNEQTLDDRITEYENSLAPALELLRTQANGSSVDATTAGEIVSHLTVRGGHVRETFRSGIGAIIDAVTELFSASNLPTLFGVDRPRPTTRVRALIASAVRNSNLTSITGLPASLLERITYAAFREEFPNNLPQIAEPLAAGLKELERNTKSIAQKSHNKALEKTFVPEERVSALRAFDWHVQDTSQPVVLPDCVALCFEDAPEPSALFLSEIDKATVILVPISTNRLLIGKTKTATTPALAQFNRWAAAASHAFFVGSFRDDELDALLSFVGERSNGLIGTSISEVVEEFNAKFNEGELDAGETAEELPPEEENPSLSYQMSFIGFESEEPAKQIASVVKEVVYVLARNVPLDRLDGVTFAFDYEQALLDLDRGFETSRPLKPIDPERGASVGMSPMVLRDGIIKTRVILRAWIGLGLISEDKKEFDYAMHLMVGQLVHAGYMALIDHALPGVLMKGFEDENEGILYKAAESSWTGYFSARFAAPFAEDMGAVFRSEFISQLERADLAVPAARLTYRKDHNLDRLVDEAMTSLSLVQRFAAQMLGHFAALEQSPFDEEGTLQAALEQAGLVRWLDVFHTDLRRLWDRRGRWTSFDEFFAVNRSLERLLWRYGIFTWRTNNGGVYISIPLGTDIEALMAEGMTLNESNRGAIASPPEPGRPDAPS